MSKSRHNMTKYEKQALSEIHAWKNPQSSYLQKAIQAITAPFSYTGDLLMKIPYLDLAIQKSVGGIINLLNDGAQWTVRPEAIYGEYRDNGHQQVRKGNDISTLDLEDVDRAIGWLNSKYTSLAGAEGAAMGIPGTINPLAGAAAIGVDVTALIALNLRAIGEYGTYCGFDMNSQAERLFALNVLAYASSPTDSAKNVAMAQLTKIAQEVARKSTWKQLREHAFVVVLENIAKALGIRLTKAKLAAVIPGVSIAIGIGFNAYFTAKVCNAAFYLYRERFLARKHGADIIEEVIKAAATFEPEYEDIREAEEACAKAAAQEV